MRAEDVLATMLLRFENGKRWAPCHAADTEGRPVEAWGGSAKRRCVIAMAASITGNPLPGGTLLDEVQERIRRAAGLRATVEIPDWNDSRANFGEVEAVLRAAIEDGK